MQPAHISDAGLVALCARSDESALATLYDRYASSAYGLALRILRDAALAEDAVQEAFLAAWRGAGTFDGSRSRVSTWLLSLVHHKAVDLVRREEARPQRAASPEDLPESADPLVDVSRDVVLSMQRTEIVKALADLPDAQREVIELAYFGGFSQSELAERLGEPLGTIKSRTHAALGRMRELLVKADVR